MVARKAVECLLVWRRRRCRVVRGKGQMPAVKVDGQRLGSGQCSRRRPPAVWQEEDHDEGTYLTLGTGGGS